MTKRILIIGAVIVGVPILALGWWLGSPLLFDTEVSEPFPMSTGAIVPDDMTQEDVESAMVSAAGEPDAAIEEEMTGSAPIALPSGRFEDYDNFHKGSGPATIYQLEAGSHFLRLQDFDATH